MRQWVARGWWAALRSGALGCGTGAQLSVGSERPLKRQVAGGSADAPAPDGGISLEAKRCEGAVEAELQIDFQFDLDESGELYFLSFESVGRFHYIEPLM